MGFGGLILKNYSYHPVYTLQRLLIYIRVGVITHYNDNERMSLHHYCNDNGNVMKDFHSSVMVMIMIMNAGNDHYIIITMSLHIFHNSPQNIFLFKLSRFSKGAQQYICCLSLWLWKYFKFSSDVAFHQAFKILEHAIKVRIPPLSRLYSKCPPPYYWVKPTWLKQAMQLQCNVTLAGSIKQYHHHSRMPWQLQMIGLILTLLFLTHI